jgi:hypothetical protein
MTAEELLTETFKSIVNTWAIVTSLRQFAELGLPAALSAMQIQSGLAAEYMIEEGILVPIDDQTKPNNEGAKKLITDGLVTQAKANVAWAIDAASLIFMHSMLDEALESFCEVSALQAPSDWENEIEQKGFELKQIKGKTYSDLLQQALQKRLKRLRNDSVLDKCEILHRICKPPVHYTPLTGHKFDSSYLESIDGKRHNIIHSGNLGQQLHDVETDLKYLRDTANYFLALINHKYGIQLNPALMFGRKNP